jgi:hypothetical protein
VPGKPRVWSETRLLIPVALPFYAPAPDGKRFAVLLAPGEQAQKPQTQLVFLLNFFDELRRRVR